MTTFAREFAKAAKESPRLYFAPLIGAIRGAIHGARAEWNRVINKSRAPRHNQHDN